SAWCATSGPRRKSHWALAATSRFIPSPRFWIASTETIPFHGNCFSEYAQARWAWAAEHFTWVVGRKRNNRRSARRDSRDCVNSDADQALFSLIVKAISHFEINMPRFDEVSPTKRVAFVE